MPYKRHYLCSLSRKNRRCATKQGDGILAENKEHNKKAAFTAPVTAFYANKKPIGHLYFYMTRLACIYGKGIGHLQILLCQFADIRYIG